MNIWSGGLRGGVLMFFRLISAVDIPGGEQQFPHMTLATTLTYIHCPMLSVLVLREAILSYLYRFVMTSKIQVQPTTISFAHSEQQTSPNYRQAGCAGGDTGLMLRMVWLPLKERFVFTLYNVCHHRKGNFGRGFAVNG